LWLDFQVSTSDFEAVEVSEHAERECFRFEVSARDFLKLIECGVANLFDYFIR
jgi:hypothetical protein